MYYSLEKVLYFASQRLADGFHIDHKEERKDTTLWQIAKQCLSSTLLRKKQGAASDRYFLTIAGYAALLHEQEAYKTKAGYTDDAKRLSQQKDQLHAAFRQGVDPGQLYDPTTMKAILAGHTLPQLMFQAEQSPDFTLRNIVDKEARALVEEGERRSMLQRLSPEITQLTRNGRIVLHEAQRHAMQLMGITMNSGFRGKRARLQEWDPPVVAGQPEKTVFPEALVYSLLKEGEAGSVTAIGVLFTDERRDQKERLAIAQLASTGDLQLVAEDDAGSYYALTSKGRIMMLEMEKLHAAEESLKRTLESDIALEKKRAELPLHGAPMVSAEDLMRDLSLYRSYTMQLAALHLTPQEMNTVNELAIDVAFDQHELPAQLIEEWRRTSHLRTEPEVLHARREQAVAFGIQFLNEHFNAQNQDVLPIEQFMVALKQESGAYVPWHESEALIRESFYRLRHADAPVPKSPDRAIQWARP